MQTTIDRIIQDWFAGGFNGAIPTEVGLLIWAVICIVFALILTGCIGFEREYHGHAAGLRTHVLVGLGSALIMFISVYGFSSDVFPNRDPARLAAQVVSGIGFLGAGAIVQTGTSVKGLTTATTLWIVMAIGLCCGSGNIVIGVITTLLAIGVLMLLRRVEKFATKKNPVITMIVNSDGPIIRDLLRSASRFGLSIKDVDTQIGYKDSVEVLRISVSIGNAPIATIRAFVEEIREVIKPLDILISTEH
ncbi:MAG: MgtC/SapB family protein [Erysipelotrichaceae bacterium]|jgi:putative Mg2+ transporter-C (MgtC) family protein|nr:MgtC/SapB family protein [Erysipelotrichaceae bacterium]